MAKLDCIFLRIGARTRLCRCASRTWSKLGAIWDYCAACRLQSWRGGWSTLCCGHRTTDSVESKKKPGIRAPLGSSLFSRYRVCRQLLDGATNHAELSNLAMSEMVGDHLFGHQTRNRPCAISFQLRDLCTCPALAFPVAPSEHVEYAEA